MTQLITKEHRSFDNWTKIFADEFKSTLMSLDWDKEKVQVICHRAEDAEKKFSKELNCKCFSELRKMRKNGVVVVARIFTQFNETVGIVK